MALITDQLSKITLFILNKLKKNMTLFVLMVLKKPGQLFMIKKV